MSLCFLFINSAYADEIVIDHQLEVKLNPYAQTLQVQDRMNIRHQGHVDFMLHAGMQPGTDTPGVELRKTGTTNTDVPLETWRLTLPVPLTQVTLFYGGKIAHAFSDRIEAPGRQQQLLAGTISEEGVFLDAGVAWYPRVANSLQTFKLVVTLPDNWTAISQGKGPKPNNTEVNTVTWVEAQPQQDIYLIAGKYQAYNRSAPGKVAAQVFLLDPDETLAKRYLDATDNYIAQYQDLIGEYPYTKFALVENFWETGYGMPSFTLLGPTVIRLPFILHSSYPHEILHNWWGNSVYVDYATGNWSEGLTTYLADHLVNEQHGKGIDYRRDTLQRYASFVRSENDFPLREFRSRHNEGSQAIGYGKSMMVFHMLRRKLGDEIFVDSLRAFYRDHLFKTAGFEQIQMSFEKVSELPLTGFFQQWLERKGAPDLEISKVQLFEQGGNYHINGEIRQIQDGSAFDIDIPLVIYFEAEQPPEQYQLHMEEKFLSFTLTVSRRPLRVDFDPWFDLFRLLHAEEVPPTLSKLFGSQSVLFVLPSDAPDNLRNAYREMAVQWSAGYENTTVSFDKEIKTLEGYQAVWLLGKNNLFREEFLQQLSDRQLKQEHDSWSLDDNPANPDQHSLVLTQRNPAGQILAWVSTANEKSLKGLARKLPHYGKYSYLIFEGEAPTIQYKGQWGVENSPMKIGLSGPAPGIQEARPAPLWPVAIGGD